MKKFLTLVVVLMAALSVHAQEMYLGGVVLACGETMMQNVHLFLFHLILATVSMKNGL